MDFNLKVEENPVTWTPPAEGDNVEYIFNTLVDTDDRVADTDDHVKSKNAST